MERDPKVETPFWRRGPVVLVTLALLIVGTASTAFIGNWIFDIQREKRIAGDMRDSAEAARDAWIKYAGPERGTRFVARTFERAEAVDTADAWQSTLKAYLAAFERERERLEEAWDSQVKAPWREELSPRFPFDPEAAADAPVETVEQLLNPVDGRVWEIAEKIDRLTNTELEGRRVALSPRGYDAFIARARAIRNALFPVETAAIKVPFEIALDDPTDDVSLRVGDTTVGSGWTALHWEGGGAKLAARDDELDYSARDWGLLRLLSELEFGAGREGEMSWSVSGAMLTIKVDPDNNPFDAGLYQGIQLTQ